MKTKYLTTEQKQRLERQLEELYALRASGARQIQHDSKNVVLKSDAELKEAIEDINRQLNNERRTRITKIYTKRWG
jgi:hypothetical protein